MSDLSILLTIAARGGSKGIKNKNLKPILDKPLMAYTIEQAKRWGKAEHIVMSTDSEDIAAVAKEYGAEVPFMRPAELASDTAGKVPVIKHALIESERVFNKTFDCVVDLDVTAPIRTMDDLNQCLEIFKTDRPTTLFSVVPSHKSPYFNMFEVGHNEQVKICKSLDTAVLRRQDTPKVYDANASIYFYDRTYLLTDKQPLPYNPNCRIYEMDDIAGVDIDREVDFKYIEFLIKENIVSI